MSLRIRLSLTELETRETPSGIDPIDPIGGPTTTPNVPAQAPPSLPTTIPPVDPYTAH